MFPLLDIIPYIPIAHIGSYYQYFMISLYPLSVLFLLQTLPTSGAWVSKRVVMQVIMLSPAEGFVRRWEPLIGVL
jgi:hypothetical protein